MRYVKRLEAMKSRIGLQLERPSNDIPPTEEVAMVTAVLLPRY